jgi:SAM-dependent methyltransferase
MRNIHHHTVVDFGAEWAEYDQSKADPAELERMFGQYFRLFPWQALAPDAVGFDMGCGSGRWARLVAPRVGRLHCVDASTVALAVTRRNLAGQPNCEFHHASVDELPFAEDSMDFGYSLGVLHHTPDPAAGMRACVRKLRAGAPFLVYLYYAFDNRPAWFRGVWHVSDLVRRAVAGLPHSVKAPLTRGVAACVYWPLARGALLAERMGQDVSNYPLSEYRERTFYTMKTDALDRFGTRLERRFTAVEVRAMMEAAGLRDVRVDSTAPFWCAVGVRA